MTAHEWILSDDTGVSSKTIWAVMMGVITTPTLCGSIYDVPHDPSDFGRCFRLLEHFPEWRDRLDNVGEFFPKWRPFLEKWGILESLYIDELPSGKCPLLYEKMKELESEGMILDGWKKTGPGSWERKNE